MDFLNINLGNILTIFSFIVGGIYFITTLKSELQVTSIRLTDIEEELSELRKVVVSIARQEERITAMDQRMQTQGQRIDAQGERITSLDQRVFKVENKTN